VIQTTNFDGLTDVPKGVKVIGKKIKGKPPGGIITSEIRRGNVNGEVVGVEAE
jgi:hypothetical protein